MRITPRLRQFVRRRQATVNASSGAPLAPASFASGAPAVHIVSAEGRIVAVNRTFELMFGASRRLYLGKNSAILGADPIAAGMSLLDGIRRGVNRRGVWRGTIQNERFNGSTFTSRARVYPLSAGGRTYLVFFQKEVRGSGTTEGHFPHQAREQVLGAAA